MFKFKFLLWMFTPLLQRKINTHADCARYVQGKRLSFQICTAAGDGRHYVLENGMVRSWAGLTESAQFTLSFVSAAKGFDILSAKDAQPAFLKGVGSKDLVISGDFLEVLWFQGLTAFLQPPKVIDALDRTAIR
ncbi:MAG: helicase [Burkholderiales bacterium PBB4]|nr:MAG: helicase [Burkholderiales bacterium PBB4]